MNEPDPADLEMDGTPLSDVLADIAWNTEEPETCRGHPDGCVNYPDTDRCGNRTEADFPADYQGAGPMYAAVPLGKPWLRAADTGATTYVLHDPYAVPGINAQLAAAHDRYAGWSAFLDRAQAEQVANHPARSGEFTHWTGLTGWCDWIPKAQATFDAFAGLNDAELDDDDAWPEAGS